MLRDPLILKKLDPLVGIFGCATARMLAGLPVGKPEARTLILRPGGMGDLILLTIAAEEMGIDLSAPLWLIEKRSAVWAKHLELDYLCYDEDLTRVHRSIVGRFSKVINTEQRFGLAQATAILARGRGGTLYGFDTNRQAAWADLKVAYDADQRHESIEFSRLLAAAFGKDLPPQPIRRARKQPVAGLPVVGIGGLQSPQRSLTVEQWVELIGDWAGAGHFHVAGTEADRDFGAVIVKRFQGRASLFSGRFAEVCDLIAGAPEVLSMDSGFVHMASYYGIPVQALFTSGRDAKWAPLAAGSAVIRRRDLPCQPCTWFGQVPRCSNHYACKDLRGANHFRVID